MEEDSGDEQPDSIQPAATPLAAPELPHHVLTVTHLPAEATNEMLTVLFQQLVSSSPLLINLIVLTGSLVLSRSDIK